MDKLISVIIPAYNIEPYIERCLDSVCSQTYHNIEIIVIDDGSTDETGKILDDYQKKDERVSVLHKKNGGVSSARNAGLDIANGDFIGFVDGDDIIDTDMYEILLKLIEEENADIAHCGYQMVFPNRVDYYYNTKQKKVQDNEEGIVDLLSGRMIEPALYNKLYRRELFNNIRLDEKLKINEDLKVNYQLFKLSKKAVYYDVAKYHYMIRNTSATGTNKLITKNSNTLAVLRFIHNDSKNKRIREVVYKRYIYILMSICREKNRNQEYLQFQKNNRITLKKETKRKEYKNFEDKKLKAMVGMVLYFPWIFHFIYWIYDKKTGVSKKYSMEG